mmetsp:Transcript_17106/g.41628  ORF Transcript_17106/g.41628 Transcript_17106/m.41628 type:complete len:123 (+) Transcript_17106:4611-4979(+)
MQTFTWKRTKSRLRRQEARRIDQVLAIPAAIGNSKATYRITKSRQVDDRDVGMWTTLYTSTRCINCFSTKYVLDCTTPFVQYLKSIFTVAKSYQSCAFAGSPAAPPLMFLPSLVQFVLPPEQ